MDEARFRELVARVEDHRLDFKSDLYSSNDELAKDLMAFANLLPPGSAAHILLGVKQRSDDTGEIIGVTLGVDRDSSYQQRVAGKLNRSPMFTFYPLQLPQGKVAVFEITGVGERPYFPIANAGKMKKFTPLKRQGSSTAEASPDEVREWVLEDYAKFDASFWLIRIPQAERENLLLIVDLLNQNFQVVPVNTIKAALVDVDSSGAAAKFYLKDQKGDIFIPLNAISRVWREGSNWRVLIEGCARLSPPNQIWEFQPRSRVRL